MPSSLCVALERIHLIIKKNAKLVWAIFRNACKNTRIYARDNDHNSVQLTTAPMFALANDDSKETENFSPLTSVYVHLLSDFKSTETTTIKGAKR